MIGVFDSGIGGLTVYQALRRSLPAEERLLYLGDTARVPYGTKGDATVARYAVEGARFLARRGVKALVVACNTMSAVALPSLTGIVPGPVLGVIEPGVEAACRATRGGAIGVIGTAATIKSGAYPAAIVRRLPGARILDRACPLFVPLAEEGWTDNAVARAAAAEYLADLPERGLDTLVLGCTHYPLLRGVIAATVGPSVALVDSAEETAKTVRALFPSDGGTPATGDETDHFYVTDSSERFREVGSRFLGRPLQRLELVDLAQ
ncbi:MAG TPA: glutamate racemase [Candidatus Polarisedimenticolia bacterium]|nr:glutamate racemase [Candidatus Polarisedimenticolia bacterium]